MDYAVSEVVSAVNKVINAMLQDRIQYITDHRQYKAKYQGWDPPIYTKARNNPGGKQNDQDINYYKKQTQGEDCNGDGECNQDRFQKHIQQG